MRQAKANIETRSERTNAIEDALQETTRTSYNERFYVTMRLISFLHEMPRKSGSKARIAIVFFPKFITTRLAGIVHDKGYLILRFIHSGCPGLTSDKESSTQSLQSTVVIKATTSLR